MKKTRMRKFLEQRALTSQCISYRDLAANLGVTQAPVIATVTALLEILMAEDVANDRPVLSALVVQKGGNSLPRPGFFEKLASLNVVDLNDSSFDKSVWHANELNKLKMYYQ